jgi:hypothetical protein
MPPLREAARPTRDRLLVARPASSGGRNAVISVLSEGLEPCLSVLSRRKIYGCTATERSEPRVARRFDLRDARKRLRRAERSGLKIEDRPQIVEAVFNGRAGQCDRLTD